MKRSEQAWHVSCYSTHLQRLLFPGNPFHPLLDHRPQIPSLERDCGSGFCVEITSSASRSLSGPGGHEVLPGRADLCHCPPSLPCPIEFSLKGRFRPALDIRCLGGQKTDGGAEQRTGVWGAARCGEGRPCHCCMVGSHHRSTQKHHYTCVCRAGPTLT